MAVRVKICGITNLDDARAAVSVGADALGFNFYSKSLRHLSADAARSIAEGISPDVMKVGVFVNEEVGAILETAHAVGLDAIQLHGDESIAFVGKLRGQVDCEVIKAFRVTASFDPQVVVDYPVDGILLDGFSAKARGGTGEIFDWEIARHVSKLTSHLWLAGGLTAENVGASISHVRPYAVDACSSLESSPGIKDATKVRRFVEEAKRT